MCDYYINLIINIFHFFDLSAMFKKTLLFIKTKFFVANIEELSNEDKADTLTEMKCCCLIQLWMYVKGNNKKL